MTGAAGAGREADDGDRAGAVKNPVNDVCVFVHLPGMGALVVGPVKVGPMEIGDLVVGQPGLEPGTSVLSGLRSNRLSYWPGEGATAMWPRKRVYRRLLRGVNAATCPPSPRSPMPRKMGCDWVAERERALTESGASPRHGCPVPVLSPPVLDEGGEGDADGRENDPVNDNQLHEHEIRDGDQDEQCCQTDGQTSQRCLSSPPRTRHGA